MDGRRRRRRNHRLDPPRTGKLARVVPDARRVRVHEARAVGRRFVDHYLGLSNYVNNWLRMGFTKDDVTKPGSDKLE